MQHEKPDVICLQETKCPDDKFPGDEIAEAGYPHQHFAGIKGYNGVAILSKIAIEQPDVYNRVGREDARHISGCIEGIHIHNLYIPAGGDIPDRDQNDKFAHKLDFVDSLTGWLQGRDTQNTPMIAVGDFNIAPLKSDVWSHKQLLKVVSHTPVEVDKLTEMQHAGDFYDAIRHFVPTSEKLYSWWSYRARDWEKSDRGRRLDHIWVTPPLQQRLGSGEIIKSVRGWEKPSDHAPVRVDIV